MKRAQWWLSLAALAGVTSGCSDDGGDGGAKCGAGTTEVDGVCVAQSGDGDGDGIPGGDGDGGDGAPVGDGDADGDPGFACGAGTVMMEGECVPAPAPDKVLNGFTVTELRLDTKGRTLMGLDTDPSVSVFHPVDVTVSVRYEGDPATIPVVIGLGEEAAGATGDGFCMLGGLAIEHAGTGEVTATKRLFLSQDCLGENSEEGEGDDVATRVMNPIVMVDPDQTIKTSSALPKGIVFSQKAQTDALDAVSTYNEALQNGESPAAPSPEAFSLAACEGGTGTGAATCALAVEVRATTGVDFELTQVGLESSVLVLNKCFETQEELDAYAATALTVDGNPKSMPTGYICNRSIVRGVDAEGAPLPYGNSKDFTYGAADLELDTTVTSFGLDDSPVTNADELMAMGSETDNGFQLDVEPEDIANNALSGDESYQVRYFLRPASVSLFNAATDASIAAGLARSGGVSALVAQKKLLPIYLHAQGEQAKADEEGSPSGQTPTTLEETVSIPQTPTEYNHGLYVENDCGRFNDPRRADEKNPEVADCNAALNPRDELLYGDYKDETEFFVVACLEPAEGSELPDSDDVDNNCVEKAVRIARVVPREAQWAAQNQGSGDENPFESDPDDLAAPGLTDDKLFAAGDAADAYAATYDYDQAIGNEHFSFNAHAHSRSSITLQNGASTDNEAKLFLRSGTLDFSMDLVRFWAQAAARTIIVGSYYDYGLSMFGVQYMGERKELEFHKEWDWNITKKWEKSKSLFVKICWVDVGASIEGQAGFRVDLDVVARELPSDDNRCDLGDAECECDTPECSALKTNFPNSEAVGEASVTLTPYGSLKANIFAAISIQVARAGAAGELTVVQIGIPAKGAINWGLDGSVLAPQNATLKLAAWANLRLESSFMRGRLYLFAENRSIDWCRKWWSPPYPCGFSWSQFWDQTLASWDGWTYNQLLWASPLYRADLTRNGLSIPQPGIIPANRDMKIVPVHSGKCLDMWDRQWLTQYSCHAQPWQRFQFQDLGNGVYQIKGNRFGHCVDVNGGGQGNGTGILGWPCHGGDNQKVRLEAKGDAYMIKFVHSGKCLDVPGWSQGDSQMLHQWDCHGGTNQLFRITPW